MLFDNLANVEHGFAVGDTLDVVEFVGRNDSHFGHDDNVLAVPLNFVDGFRNGLEQPLTFGRDADFESLDQTLLAVEGRLDARI